MSRQRVFYSIAHSFWLLMPIAVVLAFIAVELARVAPTITISNLDYFPLVDRARILSFRSLEGWAAPIHPVGFPGMIRAGLALGWDAERVAREVAHYEARVAAERESQRMPDDSTADAARLGAPDVRASA